MDPAVTLFNKLMEENNLLINLLPAKVRYLQDGAVMVEQPQLQVTFKPEELTVKKVE